MADQVQKLPVSLMEPDQNHVRPRDGNGQFALTPSRFLSMNRALRWPRSYIGCRLVDTGRHPANAVRLPADKSEPDI